MKFLGLRAMLCVAMLMPLPAWPAAQPAAPVPLLWEVRGKGDSRVMLLGSFHLLKEQDHPLSADVERAYRLADRLVFELAPDEMASPELARKLMAAGTRSDGRRLQDTIATKDWERLSHWATSRQLPVSSFQSLQPWMAALTVNLQGLSELAMRADLGVEADLMARGRRDGKTMQGLETGDQQIAVFRQLDPVIQGQMLGEALDEADSGGAQVQSLYGAWRNGEADRVWQLAGAELRARTPALYDVINTERNDAWMTALPQWLEAGQGTTLVVVGALHLVGKDGVVERLQDGGASVKRLCTVDGCRAALKRKPARR